MSESFPKPGRGVSRRAGSSGSADIRLEKRYGRRRVGAEHLIYESGVDNEREKELRRIFGDEMMDSFNFNEDAHATHLFQGLFNLIFDAGTNRNVSCEIACDQKGNRVVSLSEMAVPIHTRSSLISCTMDYIKQGKAVSFGMIDLQDFRDADFDLGARDKGIHSADVLVNKTARTIRQALQQAWEELGLEYSNNSYEVARYGGDELVIAFIGEYADRATPEGELLNLKSIIMDKVQLHLQRETGYYMQKGKVVEIPIQLKKVNEAGEFVEWLQPPEFGPQREIYLDFFQRGTLFSAAEFSRILSKYSPHGSVDMQLYRKDYPKNEGVVTYPEGVGEDLDKKTTYIIENHPELRLVFDLAKKYDKDIPLLIGGKTRKERLLEIIEGSIFDRLLGDMIYSKSHLGEHIKRGELSDLYIIDLKYLKEINTGMTYADADMEIKKIWKRIKATLSEKDRKKIIVSRFAGALYIGVRKGEKLSNPAVSLGQIKTTQLFDHKREESYSVPLGYVHKKIHPHEYKKYYQVIDDAEKEADKNFYKALASDLIHSGLKDSSFISDFAHTDITNLERREYQVLKKPEMYALLLKGKRKHCRSARLKEILPEVVQGFIRSSAEKAGQSLRAVVPAIRNVYTIGELIWKDLEKHLSEPIE